MFMKKCVLVVALVAGVRGQLKILLPTELASDAALEGGVLYGTTAVFGTPSYGHRMIGRLFYREMGESLGCAEADFEGFPEKPTGDTKAIVLVRRGGGCTFARKTENAEKAKFDAVVVVDTSCAQQAEEATKAGKPSSHCRTPEDVQRIIMANDGTGADVRIPSILVASQQGEKVLEAVKKSSEQNPVLSMLLWDLPRTNSGKNPVTVDLWMSTGAADSMAFLNNFRHTVATLGSKLLTYTPHFYIIETQLKLPGCLETSDKRYFCDPQMSSDAIVREDLRQLCLFRLSSNKQDYWRYVARWYEQCAGGSDKFLSDECSNGVLAELKIPKPELIPGQCDVSLLAEQASHRAWSSHALQINGWRYSGPLDADAVTRTVCAAFTNFPDECEQAIKDKMPTIDHSGRGGFWTALFWVVVFMVPTMGVAAWTYKTQVRKSLYRSLREEVMLEVRAQIQDYALLSDSGLGGTQLKTLRTSRE